MSDQNKDRSQDEGQQGIDRETEQRNRENETGQQQPARSDTDLDQRSEQKDRQDSTVLGSSEQSGGQSGSGFVGTGSDQSSDYLTKGEQNPDFAPEGQGAQDTSASPSDIETGQAQDRDSSLDDGSDSNR